MSPSTGESESTRTPWYIWFWLTCALAIFALAAFVIYYRFMTTPETNCSIVVQGNKDLEGCTITVERVTLTDGELQRLTDTFNQGNGNATRFFLPSATYRVQLWSKEQALLQTYPNEFIPPGSRLTLDLSRAKLAPPAAKTDPNR